VAHEIKFAEVVTLFGFERKGDRDPGQFFRSIEARDTELGRLNAFSLQFATEMDINIRFREPIEVIAIRTEDGRYFRLTAIPEELLKD
jgi:hypothetical protein